MNRVSRVAKSIRPTAARLALLYLAVLMTLSIGLGVVVYRTSVGTLQVQIADKTTQSSPGSPLASGTVVTLQPKKKSAPDVAELNRQLGQTIAAVQKSTIENLIIFNIAIFICGAMLCYYMAHRTLTPIENAAEAQTRFASDASHELRTPLTVMQTANEKALRLLHPSKPMQSVLQENLAEITQLKRLTESLLQLAHATEKVSLQPIHIDSVATAAMQVVTKRAAETGMSIQNTVPHVAAMVDEQSLVQVLIILLDNAMTYSQGHSIVRLDGRKDGKHVYLSVQDEGTGIAPNDLKHIFERFYRTDQSREQHPAGHGLGLSIVHELVRQQRGSIAATSTPNEGSTFTIKLAAATTI